VYKLALFFAKRHGSLLFFYSNKEKKFESLNLYEQYQSFLDNTTFIENKKFEQNFDNLKFEQKIEVVLSIEKLSNIHNFEKND